MTMTTRGTAGALITGAMLLAGCSELGPGDEPSMEGHWVSTFSSEFVGLDLEQEAARVTGRAELAPLGVRTTYRVEGSASGETLDVTLQPDSSGGVVTLAGSLQGDTLAILLDGGGFSQRFVPLVRE